MCVTSLLCGPWADLWPFYGLYCKQFSLYIKFYQCWGLQRSGPTDSPKENGRKFAPGKRRSFGFPFVILFQDTFALRANQNSPDSATFPRLKPSTEPWFELRVTVER